ncbi:hypothetical protein BD310DRAFT_58866 [Dichomitus squalens]|uniref:Uncharacterized protein n=1 Tax=Dichomitus squalens TaxID=114155 RepID=A0A4Q9Q636_9APHY|nr:hypothetical protein BD310DRAFT_58866 [Dichomitus squalens]
MMRADAEESYLQLLEMDCLEKARADIDDLRGHDRPVMVEIRAWVRRRSSIAGVAHAIQSEFPTSYDVTHKLSHWPQAPQAKLISRGRHPGNNATPALETLSTCVVRYCLWLDRMLAGRLASAVSNPGANPGMICGADRIASGHYPRSRTSSDRKH